MTRPIAELNRINCAFYSVTHLKWLPGLIQCEHHCKKEKRKKESNIVTRKSWWGNRFCHQWPDHSWSSLSVLKYFKQFSEVGSATGTKKGTWLLQRRVSLLIKDNKTAQRLHRPPPWESIDKRSTRSPDYPQESLPKKVSKKKPFLFRAHKICYPNFTRSFFRLTKSSCIIRFIYQIYHFLICFIHAVLLK